MLPPHSLLPWRGALHGGLVSRIWNLAPGAGGQDTVGEDVGAHAFDGRAPLVQGPRSERYAPDARGAIVAGGDDAGALRIERGAVYLVLMCQRWRERLAGGGVPDARGVVPAGGDHAGEVSSTDDLVVRASGEVA